MWNILEINSSKFLHSKSFCLYFEYRYLIKKKVQQLVTECFPFVLIFQKKPLKTGQKAWIMDTSIKHIKVVFCCYPTSQFIIWLQIGFTRYGMIHTNKEYVGTLRVVDSEQLLFK